MSNHIRLVGGQKRYLKLGLSCVKRAGPRAQENKSSFKSLLDAQTDFNSAKKNNSRSLSIFCVLQKADLEKSRRSDGSEHR